MEWLLVGGLLALAVLAGLAAYLFIQHRRSGTVKAVAAPRSGLSAAAAETEAQEEPGSEAAAR